MNTRIHLAKTGTFNDAHNRAVTVDGDLLKSLSESYNAGAHKAPLVLGHPSEGAPAYGWVDELEIGDNGDLYGIVDQVSPDLADAVKDGRYRNVSISWWPMGHASSPNKDQPTLRHVGVLGAETPAVKGLTPLSFAADDVGVVTVEFAETFWAWSAMQSVARNWREFVLEKFGRDTADRVAPDYLIETIGKQADDLQREGDAAPLFSDPSKLPKKEPEMPKDDPNTLTTKDFAEREASLAKREAAVKAHEANVAAAAAKAIDDAAIAFADGLIKDAKLKPAGRDVMIAAHKALAGTEEPIAFADGATKPALTAFEDLLKGAKPVIELAEVSTPDVETAIEGDDQAALTAAANKIIEANPAISFSEAVRKAEEAASK